MSQAVQATPAHGVAAIAAAKVASGLRVSVCIPARNESATLAGVVTPLVELRDGGTGLVDEVLVVDDGSADSTGPIAEALGARVLQRTRHPGKGAAMARAVRAATGDLVVFVDADVRNFGAHFVSGLLEPLLADAAVVLVKGTYRRAGNGGAGGGRVTELLARPLLRRLVPELAFVRQPLAGEVAVRRRALDGLVLETGYGVEIGMLIDVARRFGPAAVAQVDLGERIHRNRPLEELAGQADDVLAAVLSRTVAGRPRLRSAGGEQFQLDVVRIAEGDHPSGAAGAGLDLGALDSPLLDLVLQGVEVGDGGDGDGRVVHARPPLVEALAGAGVVPGQAEMGDAGEGGHGDGYPRRSPAPASVVKTPL